MSDKPSGYGLMQFGGQERPFQVGPNQGIIFSELQHRRGEDGRPMSLKAYGELFGLDSLREQRLAQKDLRDFIYSALAAGYEEDGLTVDFTPQKVGNWLGDPATDPDEAGKPIGEMLNQMRKRVEAFVDRASKNEQAPTPTPAKAKGPKKA